jgi:NAD(P)-dependent dehydrogenase (short-subunit alcohol dehydrogenase family)
MQPITVITGGSRGIGAATAIRLAADGHQLAIGYRQDAAAADRIVQRITAAGGIAVAVQLDTASEEQVIALFDRAAAQLGPVTGLVNNAGITSPMGPLADLRTEDLRRVIDVNVIGYFLCAREAARRFVAGAAIVNVSSGAATLGSPHEYVHYAASKAAVDALTIGLSKELASKGIRVNTVSPGVIRTDLHAISGDPDRPDKAAARIPLGRPGEPEEVASAIAWLLGPEASFTTGATLRVAGGA